MLGRGAAADPALFRKLNGGRAAERTELKEFHDLLYGDYCSAFGSEHSAMMRMKELWFYMEGLFEGGERLFKRLRKEQSPKGYEAAVAELFASLPLRQDAQPVWRS